MADAKADTSAATQWRSTVDPKSGRTYYYHKLTKETRWDKPDEMCDPEERREKQRLRQDTVDFFRSMEKSITGKIEAGWKPEIEANTRDQLRLSSEFAMLTTDFGEIHQFNPDIDVRALSPRNLSPSTTNRESFRVRSTSGLNINGSRFVRTFSSMDDEMLELFRNSRGGDRRTLRSYSRDLKDDGSYDVGRNSSPTFAGFYMDADAKESSTPRRVMQRDRSSSIDDKASPASRDRSSIHRMSHSNRTHSPDLESSNKNNSFAVGRQRRNSTGTLYVSTTMSQQDDEVTIICVCRVIRAHMMEAAKENIMPLKEFDVFKDKDYRKGSLREDDFTYGRNHSPSFGGSLSSPGKSVSFSPMADEKGGFLGALGTPLSQNSMNSPTTETKKVPALEVVVGFFKQIYKKSQLESECIIMTLIYCERLIKDTRGRLCIRYDNWRPILFACLVMSSKVWDDMSMWNADFSQILPSYNLKRINELELAMLDALKFTIRVSASEYAKYYFLLRSMIAKLGLHKGDPNYCKPLDIQNAKRLQLATEKFDSNTGQNINKVRRSVTMANLQRSLEMRSASRDDLEGFQGFRQAVGLEQLIHAEHNDADGRSRTLRKKERDSGCLDGGLEASHPATLGGSNHGK